MNKHGTRRTAKAKKPKTKLGLPDLDHSKAAILDSLESKRGYRHAIDEFIQWYSSEPRLSFNKVVVTRFRIALENRGLAAGTINGRLAAVRRLAYEAADAGLLSPELAAGIRRVKGVKKLGVRLGNWLTAEEARRLSEAPDANNLKGKRDRAILAVLLGCGLRRRELADLDFKHLQQPPYRQERGDLRLDLNAHDVVSALRSSCRSKCLAGAPHASRRERGFLRSRRGAGCSGWNRDRTSGAGRKCVRSEADSTYLATCRGEGRPVPVAGPTGGEPRGVPQRPFRPPGTWAAHTR
jgi:integrase